MRFACCHLVTLGACVLLRKVSVGMSFEWKTSDACGRKPVGIYTILSFRGFPRESCKCGGSVLVRHRPTYRDIPSEIL